MIGRPDAWRIPPQIEYFVGLDLGQASDYTAMAVAERVTKHDVPNPPYSVRHLARFPLGTSYPKIVSDVGVLLSPTGALANASLVVDATGVGLAIVDMFRQQGLSPVAITITAGTAVKASRNPATMQQMRTAFNVPKRDLVTAVDLLLQSDRLKIAKALPEAQVLIQELLSFKRKITARAKDEYGVWREGTHDDMVFAVALALWYGETKRKASGRQVSVLERPGARVGESLIAPLLRPRFPG